uniref:Uncharacterized protein n=1 Tax=Chromera velia CCMP2878 TaxID=1169474 RepID=A0A0G4GZQ0_9ALVE|eukprot:Cvel_24066.t1-p1 / transcript=Cvel_24066.t1 / gene=Cvel_24066 / organism=Chromera_velia_CCMP2878 / gene_product=hypothetical protein / transcript_product=hypothetical protein / location=Cvel_scaffold2561:6201-10197(-) / protein_length=198 / sequence_SO=supercontig / SO=protein_coding / is_pseudo=false
MKLSPQAATSTGFFRGPVSDEARAEEARRRVEAELDSANWSDWLGQSFHFFSSLHALGSKGLEMFKGTVKPEALGAVEEFVNTANPSQVLDDRQRARAKQLTETLSRFRTEGEEERAAYYRAMKGDKRLARLFATGGISTQHDNLKGQLRIGYKSSDWKSQARATHSDDPHTTTNFTRFKLTKPCRHIDPWAGKTFLT